MIFKENDYLFLDFIFWIKPFLNFQNLNSENILTYWSLAQLGWMDEKTVWKSRWSLPLRTIFLSVGGEHCDKGAGGGQQEASHGQTQGVCEG